MREGVGGERVEGERWEVRGNRSKDGVRKIKGVCQLVQGCVLERSRGVLPHGLPCLIIGIHPY